MFCTIALSCLSMLWKDYQLAIGNCLTVKCEPEWSLNRAWSDNLQDYDLWYVWAGRGVMKLHKQTIDLHPGVAIFARPGGKYLASHDPQHPLGVTATHFDLKHHRTGHRPTPRQLPGEYRVVIDPAYVETIMKRIVALAHQSEQRQGKHRRELRETASTLLLGLLRDITSPMHEDHARRSASERRHRQLIDSLAAEIRQSPGKEYAIPELARQVGYGVDHFTRVFKSVTGQSPGAFIIAARINRAMQLLGESSMTISEIADALGYADVYFFSRQFKQNAGVPPTQYRSGRPGKP